MIRPSRPDILNEETRPCGVIQIPWDDFEMAESSAVREVVPRGPGFAGYNSGEEMIRACIYWIITTLRGSVVYSAHNTNQEIIHKMWMHELQSTCKYVATLGLHYCGTDNGVF